MSRLLLYGDLPPPYTGKAICFSKLVDALHRRRTEWPIQVVSVGAQDWRPGKANVITSLRTVRQILSVLLQLPRTDLFYVTIGLTPLGFLRDALLIWAARLLGRKVVARVDGGSFHQLYQDRPWAFRWLVKGTVNQITVFSVLSESIKVKCKVIPGLEKRLQVLSNGGEIPANVVPKSLPKEGPVRVVYLSNLLFEKGYADLLEAVRLLREKRPDCFRLEIAGAFMVQKPYSNSDADVRDDFWRRVRDAGLEGVTTYHGVTTGKAKDRLLRDGHLFVLPTYYRYEGQPLSVIEAMSYGMPVIVTPWAALPEMVTDGENGFLTPPQNPRALADGVARAIATPETYASLSRAALDRFRRDFTLAAHVEGMLASFKAAIAVEA